MAIEGPLQELSLEDVLQLLELARKTGVLELRSRAQNDEAEVRFDAGMIVAASRRRSTRWIGQQLLQAGKLTERELERALEAQRREPEQRLGEVLLEMGSIEREVLEEQLRFQLEETVYELMAWTEGEFRFEELNGAAGPAVGAAGPAVGVAVRVESLLMEGARRIDEWSRLESKVPSPESIPALAPADAEAVAPVDAEAAAPLDLRPDEWEVLAEIDGDRDVGAIGAILGRSTFEVAKIVYGLASTGIVEVHARASRPAERDRAASIREIEAALRAGELDDAIRRARELQAVDPEDAEIVLLHGRALAAKRRVRAATEAFARAAALDPLGAEARYRLGIAAARVGEFDRAVDALDAFLRLAPDDARAALARRAREAVSTLRRTLDAEPNELR